MDRATVDRRGASGAFLAGYVELPAVPYVRLADFGDLVKEVEYPEQGYFGLDDCNTGIVSSW
jgi:hypothetical protein